MAAVMQSCIAKTTRGRRDGLAPAMRAAATHHGIQSGWYPFVSVMPWKVLPCPVAMF